MKSSCEITFRSFVHTINDYLPLFTTFPDVQIIHVIMHVCLYHSVFYSFNGNTTVKMANLCGGGGGGDGCGVIDHSLQLLPP